MFVAAYCFLGIAGFIIAGVLCLSMAERAAAIDNRLAWKEETKPSWDEKAQWDEIKALWLAWCAQCQQSRNLKRNELCSWSRTLAMCAALCLVGVLLEVQYSRSITPSNILAGFRQVAPAVSRFQPPPAQPSKANAVPLANRSPNT